MNRTLSLLLLSFLLFSAGCTTLRTRTTGTVEVYRQGQTLSYSYESEETQSLSLLAGYCMGTFWLFGGACWGYLEAPNVEQSKVADETALAELHALGQCVRPTSTIIERVSWGFAYEPRTFVLRDDRGNVVTAAERMQVCTERSPGHPPPRR